MSPCMCRPHFLPSFTDQGTLRLLPALGHCVWAWQRRQPLMALKCFEIALECKRFILVRQKELGRFSCPKSPLTPGWPRYHLECSWGAWLGVKEVVLQLTPMQGKAPKPGLMGSHRTTSEQWVSEDSSSRDCRWAGFTWVRLSHHGSPDSDTSVADSTPGKKLLHQVPEVPGSSWPWQGCKNRGTQHSFRKRRREQEELFGNHRLPTGWSDCCISYWVTSVSGKGVDKTEKESWVSGSCCSVAKSCPTLWDPMDCSTSGSSVLHYYPEFA